MNVRPRSAEDHTLEGSAAADHNVVERHLIDIASVLLFVAAALFIVNVLPTFSVGFYNDDYRNLDLFQEWGVNLWRAVSHDGDTQGFRPLTLVQRLLTWNIVGERPIVHRLILVSVHLGFGWVLIRGVQLLDGSRLHAAVVVTLYFGSQVTRDTIYRFVAFTPANILALGALVVMLAGVRAGWSPQKLAISTFVVAALAVFSKEDGIAASGGVLLLTAVFWNKLTVRHRIWIIAAHLLLTLVYLAVYLSVSSKITEGSISGAGLTIGQAAPVIKGYAIAAGAPFSAIYLSLRAYGLAVPVAGVVSLLALLSVALLVWTAHGRDPRRVLTALRPRLALGLVIALMMIGFLVPYLPNKWFESRMLVSAFALGTLFWGFIIADAIQALIRRTNQGGHQLAMYGVGLVVMLGALAAGSPLDQILGREQQTAEAMRGIVREAEARGVTQICLVGFKPSGGARLLRRRNAAGVIGYESRRQISAHFYPSAAEIPENLACSVVTYDPQVINEVPMTVHWPRASAQDSAAPDPTQR